MSTYKITPLEWRKEYTPTNNYPKEIAETIIGDYRIIHENDVINCYLWDGWEQNMIKSTNSVKIAKEAAQADYVDELEKILIKV